jgi:hypothetical protein
MLGEVPPRAGNVRTDKPDHLQGDVRCHLHRATGRPRPAPWRWPSNHQEQHEHPVNDSRRPSDPV